MDYLQSGINRCVEPCGGGGGGITAGANVGAGTGDVFRDITGGTTFNLRTMLSPTGTVSIVTNGDAVEFEATASNVGGGEGIFAGQVLADKQFKSLTSTGATVTITSTATTVNVEAVGVGASLYKVAAVTIVPADFTASSTVSKTVVTLPAGISPRFLRWTLRIETAFDSSALITSINTTALADAIAQAGKTLPNDLSGTGLDRLWAAQDFQAGDIVASDAVTLELTVPGIVPTVGAATFIFEYLEDV